MGFTFTAPQREGGAGGGKASADGGIIDAGDAIILLAESLDSGESFEITEAGLTLFDGQAAPTGLQILIITLDGAGGGTLQDTALSGDGTTIFGSQTGSPLASYENSGSGSQNVAAIIDNGDFGAGSGSRRNVSGRVVADVG